MPHLRVDIGFLSKYTYFVQISYLFSLHLFMRKWPYVSAHPKGFLIILSLTLAFQYKKDETITTPTFTCPVLENAPYVFVVGSDGFQSENLVDHGMEAVPMGGDHHDHGE